VPFRLTWVTVGSVPVVFLASDTPTSNTRSLPAATLGARKRLVPEVKELFAVLLKVMVPVVACSRPSSFRQRQWAWERRTEAWGGWAAMAKALWVRLV